MKATITKTSISCGLLLGYKLNTDVKWCFTLSIPCQFMLTLSVYSLSNLYLWPAGDAFVLCGLCCWPMLRCLETLLSSHALEHYEEHFQVSNRLAVFITAAFTKTFQTLVFRNGRFCCFTSYGAFALYTIGGSPSVLLKLQLIVALIFEATMSPTIKTSLLRPCIFCYFN